MKKIAAAMALVCLIGSFVYAHWDGIFQKGNPIPYLTAASKITKADPYVEVAENILISKKGESQKIFEDFEKAFGVQYLEQAGSGHIFTDGTNYYTISSEIYWGRYVVWTLPMMESVPS